MSRQNGQYDQAALFDAFQALLRGETVRVRFRDRAERERLRSAFKRYATRLNLVVEIRTQEQFLIVRWNKPPRNHQN